MLNNLPQIWSHAAKALNQIKDGHRAEAQALFKAGKIVLYEVGDKVFRIDRKVGADKLKKVADEQFEIIEVLTPVTYRLKSLSTGKIFIDWSGNLRPCQSKLLKERQRFTFPLEEEKSPSA